MSNYRRSLTKGATYFFTVVTCKRQRILTSEQNRKFLRQAIKEVKTTLPFTIEAWVLLPDHLHCIWTLPADDNEYSKRWGQIKAKFSKQTKPYLHREQWMTASKQKHRENTVWQRRFWEHQIRDDFDFHRHVDYIHYNPVKHGLVKAAINWPHSTFHKYVRNGTYPTDWATNQTNDSDNSYGE